MIRIDAIADYLAADFTIIGIARLFHNMGYKIVLGDGTSVDVFDDCTIIARGQPSPTLLEALNELPYQSEGIIRVMLDHGVDSNAMRALPRAS